MELMVSRIGKKEMKEAGCGSYFLLHDGWSHSSIHFVGLFAYYYKRKLSLIQRTTTIISFKCLDSIILESMIG